MSATVVVLIVQFILGPICLCIAVPYIGFPKASTRIDHPSRPWRIFYRIMLVGMCNFLSATVTFIAMIAVMGQINDEGLSDISCALLMAILPIPLLVAFYWFYVRGMRMRDRESI
ncbi:hypothetical protein ACQZ2G_12045 [Pseudomonas viridiflava]|uniref:hypothetical protein n=1 Tax=Pseudomonas viridiflava TaxID=33069 RepID=UPI000F0172FD|nr:hypothetical protein [Pseudomonas viridiflava]